MVYLDTAMWVHIHIWYLFIIFLGFTSKSKENNWFNQYCDLHEESCGRPLWRESCWNGGSELSEGGWFASSLVTFGKSLSIQILDEICQCGKFHVLCILTQCMLYEVANIFFCILLRIIV
jgi:hypothetical protein